jgi:hypothetical protein
LLLSPLVARVSHRLAIVCSAPVLACLSSAFLPLCFCLCLICCSLSSRVQNEANGSAAFGPNCDPNPSPLHQRVEN